VSDRNPSPRVELIKLILAVCTIQEFHDLKKIKSNTTRSKNKKVGTSFEAVASSTVEECTFSAWWSKYAPEDVVTLDCEFVKSLSDILSTPFRQPAANVDIARYDGTLLYSSKVYPTTKSTWKLNLACYLGPEIALDLHTTCIA
jgi:hypothetical protein